MRSLQVLIADPLPIVRADVRTVLRRSDFDVVEAASLDGVLRAADEHRPDIALIDLSLPPSGGVAAVHRLTERSSTYVVVWGIQPSRETVLEAVRAGAHGVLRKDISPEGLVRALRGISQGEAPITRDLASLMVEALHGLDEQARARDRASVLSAREHEVLDLIVRGARNKEIAAALVISEFTAKRHVQNILQKLELPSRRAASSFYQTAYGEPQPAAVDSAAS